MDRGTRRLQKVVGAIIALVLLSLLSPLILLVAIAIKFTSPGPVFVAREGLSRDGSRFTYHVFRARDGRTSQYTAVGRFLRACGIDLLPKMWSLLCGRMILRDML